MRSFGVLNILDKLSGKPYFWIPSDEENVKKLLIGHRIKKVSDNILQLDNGVKLKFVGNEGCCCGAGEYDITELNDCDNVITKVEFEEENKEYDDISYKLFVYSENKKIKLLQCDGNDGNGYYGTGYHIEVTLEKSDK